MENESPWGAVKEYLILKRVIMTHCIYSIKYLLLVINFYPKHSVADDKYLPLGRSKDHLITFGQRALGIPLLPIFHNLGELFAWMLYSCSSLVWYGLFIQFILTVEIGQAANSLLSRFLWIFETWMSDPWCLILGTGTQYLFWKRLSTYIGTTECISLTIIFIHYYWQSFLCGMIKEWCKIRGILLCFQVEEAKQELKDVVEFLRNPERFKRLGGKMPTGEYG